MSELLALSDVGKDYAKVETRGGRVRLVYDLLRGRGAAHVFRALDGVSFTMRRGECGCDALVAEDVGRRLVAAT